MITQKETLAFSWQETDSDIKELTFTLKNKETGEVVEEQTLLASESGQGHAYVENLEPGEYEWSIADSNLKNNEIYIPFTVLPESASSEIIFGFVPGEEIDALWAPYVLPNTTLIGEDGALYIALPHQNYIARVKDGITERYAGTLEEGSLEEGNRLETAIGQPRFIKFDNEGNILFFEETSSSIRKIDTETSEVSTIYTLPDQTETTKFYPLENGDILLLLKSTADENNYIPVENGLYRIDKEGELTLLLELPNELMSLRFSLLNEMAIYEDYIYMLTKVYNEDNTFKFLIYRIPLSVFSLDSLNNTEDIFNSIENFYEIDSQFCNTFLVNENGLYVGAHTALLHYDVDTGEVTSLKSFANVADIIPGRSDNELIITDSDSGKIYGYNIEDKSAEILAGQNPKYSRGSITGITEYNGYLYLLDNLGSSIWKYSPKTGEIEKYVGNGKLTYASAGVSRLETGLYYPGSIVFDKEGNLYIGEQCRILKIDADTGIVENFTGVVGEPGFSMTPQPLEEARFASVSDLSIDDEGNIYVSDKNNHAVRKISTDGYVYTIIGDGEWGVPNFGEEAYGQRINYPLSTVFDDKTKTLYICDSWNNAIYTLNNDGIVNHFAGVIVPYLYQHASWEWEDSVAFEDLDNAVDEAYFGSPRKMFLDGERLYVADEFNNIIRVAEDGYVSTIVGSDNKGFNIDDPNILNYPGTIYVYDGYLYVGDSSNNILRRYKIEDLPITN